MCGIAGIARFGGAALSSVDHEALREMSQALAHRGPDGQDQQAEGAVGLGFRRLAVYDVAGGHQPLWNEDRTVALIVNGTIYNYEALTTELTHRHHFRTKSDCEPIVHLYEEHGPRCVEHLVGQFALALWDRTAGRLLLARDRLGIKPLYYTRDRERLLFASEMKSLLQHPSCPRDIAWRDVLADPAMNLTAPLVGGPPASGFADITYLPAGSYVEIDLSTGETIAKEYWSLPEPASVGEAGERRAEYRSALFAALDGCLTGEAEIGVALSGGVDSSIIAAHAARAGRRVRTFSVLSESTVSNGDSPGAMRVSQQMGLPHAQVECVARELLSRDRWKDLLWLCETPAFGPEQVFKNELFRMARASSPALKVMVSGQGADEFTGGYSTTFVGSPHATWQDFLAALGRHADFERRRVDPLSALWDARLGAPVLNDGFEPDGAADDLYERFMRTKRRDLQMYNLWVEDRLASGSGIEARAPYLDHRLVEIAAAIPPAQRPELLWDKEIVRDVAGELLGAGARAMPKVPFFHGPEVDSVYKPMVEFLRSDDHALVREAFAARGFAERVNLPAVCRLLDDSAVGSVLPNRVELVARLVNMGLLQQMADDAARSCARMDWPLPTVFTVDDWDDPDQTDALASAVHDEGAVSGATVVRQGDGVLLLRAEGDDQVYVSVDGTLMFAIPDEDPTGWLRFMRMIDGETCVAELCQSAGITLDTIGESLAMALTHGVLERVPAGARKELQCAG